MTNLRTRSTAVALGGLLLASGVVGTVAAQADAAPAPAPAPASAFLAPRIAATGDLSAPAKKEIAMQLVCSAENSSLDWRAQYGYIEDINDDRGYTGGIIGFTSGTGDMLQLVQNYANTKPDNNVLKPFLPALRKVNGTPSHDGLGQKFVDAWRQAAKDQAFLTEQDKLRDSMYFNPSVNQGKSDGLSNLGQFMYYDAIVMHGPGDSADSFGGIRKAAMKNAKTPAQGGNEKTYLQAFAAARKKIMKQEDAHSDTSRVDDAQLKFLNEGNYDLHTPLKWKVYGDAYEIK